MLAIEANTKAVCGKEDLEVGIIVHEVESFGVVCSPIKGVVHVDELFGV